MKDNKSSKGKIDDKAQALTQQVVNELDRQNSELPESTSARLQAIRQQALLQGQQDVVKAPVTEDLGLKGLINRIGDLLVDARPVTAFASVSGIAVAAYFVVVQLKQPSVENGQPLLAQNQIQQNGQQEGTFGVALLEQELSEDPEMLADLEFAAWLAEQPEVQDT